MTRLRITLVAALLVMTASGCSTTRTRFSLQSHYVPPQAAVLPVGPVEHSIDKVSLFFPPALGDDEARQLIKEAVAKSPGASVLVDFVSGTRITGFPPGYPLLWRMSAFVKGMAARVDTTGYQDLAPWPAPGR